MVDVLVEPDRRLRQPGGGGAVGDVLGRPPAGGEVPVHPERAEHPGGRGPGRGAVRRPVRSRPLVEQRGPGHPHARPGERLAAGRRLDGHAEHPAGGDEVLDGGAHQGAAGGVEVRVRDQRAQGGLDVGAGVAERLGDGRDQRRGRGVGDELAGQLAGDVLRGGRVPGQVAQVGDGDGAAVGGGVRAAEAQHPHRPGGVPAPVVEPVPGAEGVHGVAGEDLRGVLDHRLGVARAPADGVQLEQLAALVLVGRVLHRRPVVEVEQHRRVQRRGDQQVVEAAEGPGADHLVVRRAVHPAEVGVGVHVQVVGPEVDHVLQHLPLGVDPAQHRDAGQVGGVLPAALGPGLVPGPLGGRRLGQPGEPRRQRLGERRLGDAGRCQLLLEPPGLPSPRPAAGRSSRATSRSRAGSGSAAAGRRGRSWRCRGSPCTSWRPAPERGPAPGSRRSCRAPRPRLRAADVGWVRRGSCLLHRPGRPPS